MAGAAGDNSPKAEPEDLDLIFEDPDDPNAGPGSEDPASEDLSFEDPEADAPSDAEHDDPDETFDEAFGIEADDPEAGGQAPSDDPAGDERWDGDVDTDPVAATAAAVGARVQPAHRRRPPQDHPDDLTDAPATGDAARPRRRRTAAPDAATGTGARTGQTVAKGQPRRRQAAAPMPDALPDDDPVAAGMRRAATRLDWKGPLLLLLPPLLVALGAVIAMVLLAPRNVPDLAANQLGTYTVQVVSGRPIEPDVEALRGGGYDGDDHHRYILLVLQRSDGGEARAVYPRAFGGGDTVLQGMIADRVLAESLPADQRAVQQFRVFDRMATVTLRGVDDLTGPQLNPPSLRPPAADAADGAPTRPPATLITALSLGDVDSTVEGNQRRLNTLSRLRVLQPVMFYGLIGFCALFALLRFADRRLPGFPGLPAVVAAWLYTLPAGVVVFSFIASVIVTL